MYCPECGTLVENGSCPECKKEMDRRLLALDTEKELITNDRKASVLAYIFWPVSRFIKIEDKEFVNFHINQGFTVFLLEILSIVAYFIPNIGTAIGLGLTVFTVYLIYTEIKAIAAEERKKLPVIGDYIFLKL